MSLQKTSNQRASSKLFCKMYMIVLIFLLLFVYSRKLAKDAVVAHLMKMGNANKQVTAAAAEEGGEEEVED